MQAIHTRYLPCTNTRGSRVVATAMGQRVTVEYRSEFDSPINHARAARALVARNGGMWFGKWAMGETKTGFVFVALGSGDVFTFEDRSGK